MADRDLNLQLQLAKDQARRDLAEFGREAQAQIAGDLSQFQAAENAKVAAARAARSQRAQEDQAARKAEIDATIAAEQAKVQAALATDAQRRAAIKATWAAEREQKQAALALVAGSQTQILAIESSKRAAAKQTADAQRQQAAQAISQGRELVLASAQGHRELAALEGQTAHAVEQRSLATQTAMEIELAQNQAVGQAVGNVGQAYVRVRLVQQAAATSATQGGQASAAALGNTAAAANKATASVDSLGKMFLKLQLVNQVAGWVGEAMRAVGQSIANAREHIKGLVDEMEAARTAAKELAALRGEKATGQFTADLAREAANAHLDTDKYNEFQLGFQAYTGQYVGKEGATKEELQASGQKLNKEQALELQQRVASYAVGARGLSAEDSSKLLGTVIAKSSAGATNDQIMSEFAKLMKVMELAPGRTSPLIGQLAETGMESVGPEGDFKNLQQAGYLTRVMAQRNPNEASTYSRAMLRGLREIGMNEKGQMAELGITKDMDVMQQLEQIDKKSQEHVKAGGKEGEFIAKYFPEIREWGAVKTALNEGLRGGGFQRAMAEAETVNAETADAETKIYKSGREGVAASQRSRLLAEKRQNASFYEPLKQVQREQLILMEQSHELESPESVIDAIMTGRAETNGLGNREQQQLKKRTAYDLNSRLQMSKQGREWLTQEFGRDKMGGGREPGVLAPDASDRDMARAAQMLEKIAQQNERARNQHVDRPVPLVNPPQARGGVRQ